VYVKLWVFGLISDSSFFLRSNWKLDVNKKIEILGEKDPSATVRQQEAAVGQAAKKNLRILVNISPARHSGHTMKKDFLVLQTWPIIFIL
jgi:hypothetical protein